MRFNENQQKRIPKIISSTKKSSSNRCPAQTPLAVIPKLSVIDWSRAMRIKTILLSISAVVALSAGVAQAATNLVVNGKFEQTTNGTNNMLAATTTDLSKTTLTGWTSSNGNDGGYNFVLNSAIANTPDSAIWLESVGGTLPNTGNVFASDSQYYPGSLTQTISGLTAHTKYTLTFNYALAQQVGFDGANLDNYWQVGFGSATQNTGALSIPDNGFSGWKTATMFFTAGDTSQVLSFLAKGTAPGAPPFLLLDNVSLAAAVPEPETWGMMLGGIGLIGWMARRRRAAALA
jgi:hypothetical protein